MNRPLVSIACIAYNQEKYIRETIEGFLMQKTNFAVEIIIHDDASTDRTADIIREYEKKHAGLVKPIYQKENQYSKGVKATTCFVFPKCSGKYIAFCEGDDYWIDPHKLQKQVDFMEANEDYILCFTNCEERDINGNFIRNSITHQTKNTYTHSDMPILAPTLTRLFRNKYLDTIPASFREAPWGDAYLTVWQSKFGKIKYDDYCSAVYRITNQGIYTSGNEFKRTYGFLETHYAILDIVENNMLVKFLYKTFGNLITMRKKACTEAEKIVCKNMFKKLVSYFGRARKLHKIGLFAYIYMKSNLMLRYAVHSFIITFKKKVFKREQRP